MSTSPTIAEALEFAAQIVPVADCYCDRCLIAAASEVHALRAQLAEAQRERDQWRGVADKLASALRLNRSALYIENEYARSTGLRTEDGDLPFEYALEPADAALADFDRLNK